MILALRKLRLQLLQHGRIKQYLLYAIGEMIIISAGILIAIQLDNLNQNRLERKIEKKILIGIRNDILMDTIDINSNIKGYKWVIDNNFKLLDLLLYKRINEPYLGQALHASSLDYNLTLQSSHFEEAKERGLAIITNQSLRERINRLYEFRYKNLLFIENDYPPNDNFRALSPLVNPYLQLEPDKFDIKYTDSVYVPTILNATLLTKLVQDHQLHQTLYSYTLKMRSVLRRDYTSTRDEALKIVALIDEELKEM